MSTQVIKKSKTPALQILSGGVGVMGSRIVAPLVPGGAIGKMIAALGFGAIAGLTPNKGVLKHVKAAAIGAGIIQFSEGFTEAISPTVSKWADAGEPSKLKEYAKKATGLAAPDSSYYEELLTRARIQQQAPLAIESPIPEAQRSFAAGV